MKKHQIDTWTLQGAVKRTTRFLIFSMAAMLVYVALGYFQGHSDAQYKQVRMICGTAHVSLSPKDVRTFAYELGLSHGGWVVTKKTESSVHVFCAVPPETTDAALSEAGFELPPD